MYNTFIDEEYTLENLVNIYGQVHQELHKLGALFESNDLDYENLDQFSRRALDFHREGYELGEQIYDCYSEIGAINEAFDYICGK